MPLLPMPDARIPDQGPRIAEAFAALPLMSWASTQTRSDIDIASPWSWVT